VEYDEREKWIQVAHVVDISKEHTSSIFRVDNEDIGRVEEIEVLTERALLVV
jgi:hypothetical protein